MRKYLLIFLCFIFHFVKAQTESSVPWAMFHGCEKHCGIYQAKEYKNFDDVKWKFKTQGKIFSSPAVLDGVAYIGSEDKTLYAVDITTGKLKWKFQTDGAVHSSPAVYKNVVYFGSYDGYYYAVDKNNGEEIWKVKTEGEKHVGEKGYWGMKPSDQYMEDPWDWFLSSPVIDKNEDNLTVYFGSSDGNLYSVNANTGSIKWRFNTGGIIHSSPALYKGVVYIGSWNAFVYAIDASTGNLKWKFKTGEQMAMTGIQASPTVEDDVVYVGARDAHLYALKADTGDLIWTYDSKGSWIVSTAGIKDGIVYVGTSDSYLMLALNAKSGAEKFRFKANGYVISSPALAGNTVFFGDITGKLFALDQKGNGNVWKEFSTDARKKNAAAVLENDRLNFQFSAKGKDLSLYKTNVDVMDMLYSLGSIVSSPVVQHGVIYFGSTDGYLYAINLKDEIGVDAGTHNHH